MLKQLAGQTAIYGLGTIVPRFLNYLLFPYLTRVMTVGEYGVVTDLYALIPFVLVLLTMGLETGYFRFAGKAGSEAEKADDLFERMGRGDRRQHRFFRTRAAVYATTGPGHGIHRPSVVHPAGRRPSLC